MSEKTKEERRSRKVAAVLAGGLVVGIGTMATLASWSDPEYATGTFTGGTFTMTGATDQSTFTEHSTSGTSASLTFAATNLSPNDVVYAPYAVHLDKTSTYAATVSVGTPASTGTVTNLTYTLFTTAAAGCTSSSTAAATIVPAGTAVTANTGATTFSLAKPASTSTDGTPVYLCFKVTAGAQGAFTQAQTGTVTWTFTATSS